LFYKFGILILKLFIIPLFDLLFQNKNEMYFNLNCAWDSTPNSFIYFCSFEICNL